MSESVEGSTALDRADALRRLDTPCYVYDPLLLRQDYADLKQALGTGLIVSIKANPDPGLLAHCLPAFVDGIELASEGELALAAGRSVRKFVNTPALTRTCLRAALAAPATLVLDNIQQADLVIGEAGTRPVLPIVLRLNPGELIPEMNARGLADRFGMSVADLTEAAARLHAAALPIRGLHVFVGSNLFARYGLGTAARLGAMLPNLERAIGQPLEFINLGGGVPAEWRALKLDFHAYRDALAPLRRGRTLVHEAGRAMFAGCGAFVTRVLSRKRLGGCHVVVCDGGMVHGFQLAQTELSIKLPRAPKLVYADPEPRAQAAEPVLFVGNSCSNVDRIGRREAGVLLPEPGDYCVFDGVGAYYGTYTLSGFLGIPPPRVYLRPGLLAAGRD